MENLNFFMEKFFKFTPGGIYGLLSVFIGLLGDFLAFLFFPGYHILFNMVSDLGIGPGGIFFNLGVIISGLIAIPFYIYLGKILKNGNNNEFLRRGAIITSIISCIAFSLIGFFPSIEGNEIIYFLHGLFAFISWMSGLSYLLLFSILLIKDERFSRFKSYLGFSIIIIYLIFFFTWQPIIEWILSFSIVVWVLIMAIYTLYKRF